MLRTGSKGLAALTLVLDCLKATAAILLAQRLFGEESAVFAAAGAFIGHLYPVWLRFRGGKGVATFLGILIPLLPIAAGVYAAIWILLLADVPNFVGCGNGRRHQRADSRGRSSFIDVANAPGFRGAGPVEAPRQYRASARGTEPRIGRA